MAGGDEIDWDAERALAALAGTPRIVVLVGRTWHGTRRWRKVQPSTVKAFIQVTESNFFVVLRGMKLRPYDRVYNTGEPWRDHHKYNAALEQLYVAGWNGVWTPLPD
jgi:hypothetical protein